MCRPEINVGCLSLSLYTLCFETESFPGPRTYQLARLASQLILDILLSLPPGAQFIKSTIEPGFYVGGEDQML